MYKSKDNLLNDLIECEIEIRRLQSIADSLREKIFANGSRKLAPAAEALVEKTKSSWKLTPKRLKAMRANIAKAQAARYAK